MSIYISTRRCVHTSTSTTCILWISLILKGGSGEPTWTPPAYGLATIFSSLAFLFSSGSMANLNRLVAASFSSLALLSSSVSTTNLGCLLATTFSSLSFLSNSFSSPRFNLLGVASLLFLTTFSFPLVIFWLSFLLYLFCVLSSAFLSSVLQSLKLCLL